MGCPLQRCMYLQPPALRAALDLHGEIQTLSLHPKQNQASLFPKLCPFPGYSPSNWAVWVQAREKSCIAFEPQEGVRDGQKSSSWKDRLCVGLLPARLKQSSTSHLGFSSLAFLAGSSHAHLNHLLVRKIKRQTSNEPEMLSVSSSFPNHYADNYCPGYPQIRLINPTPALPLE